MRAAGEGEISLFVECIELSATSMPSYNSLELTGWFE